MQVAVVDWALQRVGAIDAVGAATLRNLEPHTFPDTGRGLRTRTAKTAGEPVIAVPRSLVVAPRDVALRHAAAVTRPLSAIQWLVVFLTHERDLAERSEWAPFVDAVPRDFATCPGAPGYATPLPLIEALLPDVADDMARQAQALERDIAAVRTVLPMAAEATCVWAWWAVNTRCVACPLDDEPRLPKLMADAGHVVLVPVLDLLNHADGITATSAYDTQTKMFTIRTTQVAAAGEQVFLSYGPHTNKMLLVHYGFVLPHNTLDRVDLGTLLRQVVDSWKHAERLSQALEAAEMASLWSDVALTHSSTDDSTTRVVPSWCLWTLVQVLAWASLPGKATRDDSARKLALGEVDSLGDRVNQLARKLLVILCDRMIRVLEQREVAVRAMDNAKLILDDGPLWHIHQTELDMLRQARKPFVDS